MKKRKRVGRVAARKNSHPAAALVKKHNKVYMICAEFINTTVTITLRLLVEASFSELKSILSKSGFEMNKEYWLSAHLRTLEGYSSIINYYNMHDLEINPRGKNMLTGIRTIFYSRLSEHKKNLSDFSEIKDYDWGNEYLSDFSKKIREITLHRLDEVLADVIKKYSVNMWNMAAINVDGIVEDIKSEIIRGFLEDFYKIYIIFAEKIKKYNEKSREAALINLQRMKEEYDILSVIIKVQTPELEAYGEGFGPINRIIDMIYSLYERLDKDITNLESFISQPGYESGVEADDFYGFMSRVLKFHSSSNELAANLERFTCEYVFILDDYDEELRAYWREKFKAPTDSLSHLIKDKEQSVLNTSELGKEIIAELRAAFYGAGKHIGISKDEPGIAQVILGIYETLSVKTSSMDHMYKEYLENLRPYLDNNKQGAFDLDKDAEEALNKYKLSFYDFFEDAKTSVKIVDDFYKESLKNAYEKRFSEAKKALEADIKNIKKLELAFKKECLFFEIVTFEEILNYSGLKLKDSESEAAKACFRVLDEADFNLRSITRKYGIDIIEPAVHELFNGRYHEVIMAKEEEGFSRGEITKLLSRGYREGQTVYARANVICAK